jgi:hypothetical protein
MESRILEEEAYAKEWHSTTWIKAVLTDGTYRWLHVDKRGRNISINDDDGFRLVCSGVPADVKMCHQGQSWPPLQDAAVRSCY